MMPAPVRRSLLRVFRPVWTGVTLLAIWWAAFEAGWFPRGTVPSPPRLDA